LEIKRRGGMERCLAGPLLLMTAITPMAAAEAMAAPADVDGWRQARWDMTQAELEDAFGKTLDRLPGRWEYGSAHAEYALFDVELGGERFTAYFQMNERDDRLQQVLLQAPRAATDLAYRSVLAALKRRYGEPDETCAVSKAGGGPLWIESTWHFPTTTVHLTLLDFYTTAMVFEDPNTDIDPLTPYIEERRNNPRFLPRRIVVRFHASGRADLMSQRDCAPLGDAG
jgi:hypothetical protein